MGKFNISAYQEMYTDKEIEAANLEEALRTFQTLLASGEIDWQPSDEDVTFTVSEEDAAGQIVSEISSASWDIRIKA